MKPGDKIEIYEDPITQNRLEGIATLIKKVASQPNLETWVVRFRGERETFIRQIRREEKNNETARD